ncbi:MAG: hypothetical protein ACKO5F_06325, partial [Synechococcus sp.]
SKMAAEARLNLAESAYSAKDYDKVKSLLADLVDAKAKGQVDESVRESAIYRLDMTLSLNRYKELVHEEVEHRPPLEILAELRAIEQEILQGIEELEGMLR